MKAVIVIAAAALAFRHGGGSFSPAERYVRYPLSVGPARVRARTYLCLWMRDDHSLPGEKTSMRSPSGSKTKNA